MTYCVHTGVSGSLPTALSPGWAPVTLLTLETAFSQNVAFLFTLNVVVLSRANCEFKCGLTSFFPWMVWAFCALLKKFSPSLGHRSFLYLFL